jgi:DDE family transposase
MNWRGRPLTSHQVIVATIAATTTGTGLRVRAELDTGRYPTGVTVSDAAMAALPLGRHGFHGDWNHTLHPPPAAGPAAPAPVLPAAADRAALSDPALTGITRDRLSTLTAALGALRAARWAAKQPDHRHGSRAQARRPGRPQRLTLPEDTLAVLFGSSATTIRRAIAETRELLDRHGTTIAPGPTPVRAADRPPRSHPTEADHPHHADQNNELILCEPLGGSPSAATPWAALSIPFAPMGESRNSLRLRRVRHPRTVPRLQLPTGSRSALRALQDGRSIRSSCRGAGLSSRRCA